jgi:hypothetical protein
MEMKMDRRLNLVIGPVERPDGSKVYIHHEPISRLVYEAHFRLVAQTFSQMYQEGIAGSIATRNAMLMLKDVAASSGRLAALDEALLPEIWRLTNYLAPGAAGYESVPFYEVINKDLLEEENLSEVQNMICFFTLALWIHPKADRLNLIYPLLKSVGAQIVSLNATAFCASLTTSTPAAPSGEKVIASSIPA